MKIEIIKKQMFLNGKEKDNNKTTKKAYLEKWTFKGLEVPEKITFLYYKGFCISCIIKGEYKSHYINNKNKYFLKNSDFEKIKEFYKQETEKDTKPTKRELLKNFSFVDFDFLAVHETDQNTYSHINTYNNYYKCTSPETSQFFRGFEGYRQRQKADSLGKYLFTRSKYGFSNYYYFYI